MLPGAIVQCAPTDELATHEELSEIVKTIAWTDSLQNWPQLSHICIHAFKASDKHLTQGYNLLKYNKVENMRVGIADNLCYTQGRVSPSMKKARYSTVLQMEGINVRNCDCTRPAGKGKCKHSVALLYALIDHIMSGRLSIPPSPACTEQPRQWDHVNHVILIEAF